MPHPPLKILLAAPRGFCAGVVRAIDIVERALDLYGAPVYVRHEIVHNKFVVEALSRGSREGLPYELLFADDLVLMTELEDMLMGRDRKSVV